MDNTCRMSVKALGLAFGVLWGVSLLLMGLLAHFFDYGTPFVSGIGNLYIGYAPTIAGSFLGAVIGFIDGFICGAVLAWLYNCFGGCVCKK